MSLSPYDIGRLKALLADYVALLRESGKSDDSYKADSIEDLLERL